MLPSDPFRQATHHTIFREKGRERQNILHTQMEFGCEMFITVELGVEFAAINSPRLLSINLNK